MHIVYNLIWKMHEYIMLFSSCSYEYNLVKAWERKLKMWQQCNKKNDFKSIDVLVYY